MLDLGCQLMMAGELNDLEQLSHVQVLLGRNDVDHLIKIVRLISFEQCTDISGQV